MAVIAKTLTGLGKTIVGAGGTILKGGAKIFGDDAVEAVGRGVGDIQGRLDGVAKRAARQDDLYKAAKNQARGIKEASKSSGDAAEKAIKTQKTQYGRIKNDAGDYEYYRETNGKRTAIDSKEYGQKRGQYISSRLSDNPNYKKKAWAFEIEEEVAGGFVDTAKEVWDGIPGWAKTTGVAVAGGIAGAALFSDDDDDY